ncbi:hypothetical protein QWZ13_03025 [Reinekea marina]|nr:hypothetical protein [Reinekea marina]MDN3647883.1 hypothetical protein [Reinekea marina]
MISSRRVCHSSLIISSFSFLSLVFNCALLLKLNKIISGNNR